MARKCAGCGIVYQDDVLYCPKCGSRTQVIQEAQQPQLKGKEILNKSNEMLNKGGDMLKTVDWEALFQKVFVEYGMLTASILALIWAWNWDVIMGTVISVAALIVPFVDKVRKYKALTASRVIAAITIILSILAQM